MVPTKGPDGYSYYQGYAPESQRQKSPRPKTREKATS
jgi:hypothetical protein